MDQHIKERLVGAGVLVVIGVLVIPEFLSGPAEQIEQTDSSIALPAGEDQEMRSHTIRLDQRGAQDQPPVAQPVAEAAAEGAADPNAEQDGSDTSEPAQTQEPVAKAEPARVEPAPVPTPEPAASDPVAEVGGWAVQVGSFSSESNAQRLAATIASMGYKSFVTTSVVDGNTRHRVRVGPMGSREEAQTVASDLQNQGQQAAVVMRP